MMMMVPDMIRSKEVMLPLGVLGSLGAGLLTAKLFQTRKASPSFQGLEEMEGFRETLHTHTGLVAAVDQFARLDPSRAKHMAKEVVELVHMAQSKHPSTQWAIARKNGDLIRYAKETCVLTPVYHSDELYRASTVCCSEGMEQLTLWLDNLLHNHLLQRLE